MVITQLKSYGINTTNQVNKNQQKNTYEGVKAAFEKRPLTDEEIQGLQDRLFKNNEEKEKKEDYTLPENIYKDIVNNYYNNMKKNENIENVDDFNETFENEIIDTLEENQDEED